MKRNVLGGFLKPLKMWGSLKGHNTALRSSFLTSLRLE